MRRGPALELTRAMEITDDWYWKDRTSAGAVPGCGRLWYGWLPERVQGRIRPGDPGEHDPPRHAREGKAGQDRGGDPQRVAGAGKSRPYGPTGQVGRGPEVRR